jgi:hypothetical protein
MGLSKRIRMPKRGAVLAGLVGFGLWIALPSMAIGVQQGETELYRWLDRHGVVRYTTDLSRIPNARRSTVIRVVPPSVQTATTRVAPAAPVPGADPFNAPGTPRSAAVRGPNSTRASQNSKCSSRKTKKPSKR